MTSSLADNMSFYFDGGPNCCVWLAYDCPVISEAIPSVATMDRPRYLTSHASLSPGYHFLPWICFRECFWFVFTSRGYCSSLAESTVCIYTMISCRKHAQKKNHTHTSSFLWSVSRTLSAYMEHQQAKPTPCFRLLLLGPVRFLFLWF